MKQLECLKFQVAFGAVRHFGRNLYSTNPPAIAELVANAWDAYAKECRIYIKNNAMLILDDGIGMTDEEFQQRYATSGNEKSSDIRQPDQMHLRPYMGKKGIGKFSAFSLADEYELYTKSEIDTCWKHIKLEQGILSTQTSTYDVPIKRVETLDNLCQVFGVESFNMQTGTIIYLPRLKRSVTSNTISALEKLLSHRFSITTIINDGNFAVSIVADDRTIAIDLKQHFYYCDLEYVHYFGYSEEEIKARFPKLTSPYLILEEGFNDTVKGWIGSVAIPSSLMVEDTTALKGISVYINGKLVDEDILKGSKKDRISDAYIIGEVDADYLGLLPEDVVLSSREGLFLDHEEVSAFRNYLDGVRRNLVSKWDEMRRNRPIERQDYLNVLMTNPENKRLYDGLKADSRERFDRYAQKLFDRPKVNDAVLEKLHHLLFSALLQIVNNEDIANLISQGKDDEDIILECLSEILNLSEVNHALRLRDSVRTNLSIIAELEKYVESGEVEKVFERHLAKSPWLIEPTWMGKGRSVHTQDYYTLLDIDNGNVQKYYTDIIVEVTDELYPVIVEIKREKATAYSTPNVNEICTQLYNYQKGLAEALQRESGKRVLASEIKAYFICGRVAFNRLDANDREKLQANGIQIRSYDELIRTAKRVFEVSYGEDLIL